MGNSLTPVLLKYDDGTNSAVSLLAPRPRSATTLTTTTLVAGYDGTLFNDAIYGSLIFADMNAVPFTFALSVRAPNAAYSLSFGASRNATGPRFTQITDGTVTLSYDATLTPPPTLMTGVFAANAAGVITLTVSNPAGTALNTWAYLCRMRVTAA